MNRNRRLVKLASTTAILSLALTGCTPGFLAEEFAATESAASDAAAKANIANANVAALEFLLDNPSLPANPAADLAELGWPQTGPVVNLVPIGTSGTGFCLWAVSASGTSFMTATDQSIIDGDCR